MPNDVTGHVRSLPEPSATYEPQDVDPCCTVLSLINQLHAYLHSGKHLYLLPPLLLPPPPPPLFTTKRKKKENYPVKYFARCGLQLVQLRHVIA